MISFDRDEFWFICIRFTEKYLNYIADNANMTLPSSLLLKLSLSPVLLRQQENIIEEDEMAQFQLIGPFQLERRAQMNEFIKALLSIIFKQMRETEAGKAELAALISEVY
jgi:hypothetical protein